MRPLLHPGLEPQAPGRSKAPSSVLAPVAMPGPPGSVLYYPCCLFATKPYAHTRVESFCNPYLRWFIDQLFAVSGYSCVSAGPMGFPYANQVATYIQAST